MRTIITLFILTLCLSAAPALAQGNFSVELRGAAAFPTSSLGEADLKFGAGFELLINYEIIENGSVYAGWGWNRMTSDELIASQETDVEETGYRFGLEYAFPINDGPSSIFVMAGGLYNHLEFEDSDGEIFEDTGHGLGWNVGLGLDYQITEAISIRPSVKYFSLNRDMEMNSEVSEATHQYLSAGLGLAIRF
jgi:opacity protein-like surface antigen